MEKQVCKEREGWICSWDRISLKVTRYQGPAHKNKQTHHVMTLPFMVSSNFKTFSVIGGYLTQHIFWSVICGAVLEF